ncbi:MAG: DUF3397 domain-containing protein [Lactobacillus sp.]|nr:DUF3397 domain-containing protein [Lactobacillus sp.]
MLEVLEAWYVTLISLILLWIVLSFLKRYLKKIWPKKLRVVDIMMLFLVVAIAQLSVELTGLSLLPFLAFAVSAYGLALTVYLVYTEDDFRLKRFIVVYWRTLDILMLLVYCVLLFIKTAQETGVL